LSSSPKTVSRAQQGEGTRRRILDLAMAVASKQGLGALSIGELAKKLRISKSGLFAHFGSKEELQIATVEAAEQVFEAKVVKPAGEAPGGLPRLRALLENHIGYLEAAVFPGGCFFSAASAEFDDQPGRVRDHLADRMRAWRDYLRRQVRVAQESGELDGSTDAAQLVFELDALVREANFAHRLLGDPNAFEQARAGIRKRLSAVAKRGQLLARKAR
jgi:AcrR family transcriptional regulator